MFAITFVFSVHYFYKMKFHAVTKFCFLLSYQNSEPSFLTLFAPYDFTNPSAWVFSNDLTFGLHTLYVTSQLPPAPLPTKMTDNDKDLDGNAAQWFGS